MKKIRLFIFCLSLLSILFLSSCYEPIANTNREIDRTAERTTLNDNSSVENMDKKEDSSNLDENKDSTKDTMKVDDSSNKTEISAEGFRGNLSQNLSRNGLTVTDIYDSTNPVESRILAEYGSVFLTTAMPPAKTMFTSEEEVSTFQSKAGVASANIGGINIELQPAALKALQDAVAEAKSQGLKITPRDGAEAARRNYQKTLTLWNSRFEPALKHWKSKGRLKDDQISRLKSLPIKQQVQEVLELEKKKIYFNTFFNGSILQSVAAPGTSQHISMLAFDATEFQNKKVREIMAKHGWFRTVQNDEPHFTYLGHKESDLPKLGLKKVIRKKGEFWIPDM